MLLLCCCQSPASELVPGFKAFFKGKGHPRFKGSNRRNTTKLRIRTLHRRLRNIANTWRHRLTCHLADKARLLVLEKLNTRSMTASAKGITEAPDKHVKARTGVNRSISSTGWTGITQMLTYKTRVVHVNIPASGVEAIARGGAFSPENSTLREHGAGSPYGGAISVIPFLLTCSERRGWDSNPRGFWPYTISSRAQSTGLCHLSRGQDQLKGPRAAVAMHPARWRRRRRPTVVQWVQSTPGHGDHLP